MSKRAREPRTTRAASAAKRTASAVAPVAAKTAIAALALSARAPQPLFALADEDSLVPGVVLRRPSARNKSPYVGDVQLSDGRVAIAHMPSMDMGGKCVPGAAVLLKTQIDKATKLPIGPDVVGKYGTPKCEFILKLLRCTEPENASAAGGGCWVGAHPSLGEKAANALIAGGSLESELGEVAKIEREVPNVAGTDMRCDFLLTHRDRSKTILEVKTVVDTDYDPAISPPERFPNRKCVFLGKGSPYARAAIFPWGNSNQKGPDGEKVVSARAIKHVRELTAIARGEKREAPPEGTKAESSPPLRACVLFVVVRSDATYFRPNEEACPSFARYLREAQQAGVRVLARRVRWGEEAIKGEALGAAIDDGPLRVELSEGSVD